MTILESPTWHTQHFAVPRAAATLFGYHVSRLRSDQGWTPTELVECVKGKPTAEWLLAIEEGEVELTREIVLTVQHMLNTKASAAAEASNTQATRIELLPTLLLLVEYPYGDLAMRLRRNLRLWSSPQRIEGATDDSPSSVQASISPSARLLVLAPVLAFAAVWALSFRTLELNLARTSIDDADHLGVVRTIVDSVVWPLAVLGGIAAAFALETMDRLLVRIGGQCRRWSIDRRTSLATINTALWSRGIPWMEVTTPTRPRVQPGDPGFRVNNAYELGAPPKAPEDSPDIAPVAPYLIPAYRSSAVSSGLRCRFAERLEASLLASTVISGLVAAATTLNGFHAWDLASAGVSLASLVLMIVARADANREFKSCAFLVSLGLGVRATAETRTKAKGKRRLRKAEPASQV